jgi:uncharacterized protein
MARLQVPAVEGWFTVPSDGEAPKLLGAKCSDCGTYVFPPRSGFCPNPSCDGDQLTSVPLSSRGRIWSYTENRYAPPPPFVVTTEPFAPYAIAAVELEAEGLVILGQVGHGIMAADLKIGMEMEIEIDVLCSTDEHDELVWKWIPAAPKATV